MGKSIRTEELENEIRSKRAELNRIVCEEPDRDMVLNYSQELDELINKYYHSFAE